MQYTLRNVPPKVDLALREKAQREGKSLNEVTVATLAAALGVEAKERPQRDLGDIAGTWVNDRAVDRALADQRTIDPDLWR